jgi:hypothetical protein
MVGKEFNIISGDRTPCSNYNEFFIDTPFVGFIPDKKIVTSVWLGNDDNSPTKGSSAQAAQVWGNYMGSVYRSLTLGWLGFDGSQPNLRGVIPLVTLLYIQNQRLMVGKDRVDLSIDPPPDLAIAVDVTSKTQIGAYLKLQVAELWVYADDELKIYVLQAGAYQLSTVSHIFRGLPVLTMVQNLLKRSATIGRSQSLRDFRQDIRLALANIPT